VAEPSESVPLHLRDLDAIEMAAALAPFGVTLDVSRRVFAAVHRDGVSSMVEAQPRVRGLSAATARAIDRQAIWPTIEIVDKRQSADGFVKYLFRLPGGAEIEAVRIPLPDPDVARAMRAKRAENENSLGLVALPTAKYTVCLSSQAGCALACDFCETGRLGGIRNLDTWEIVAQLRHIAADAELPIRGAVFMGMGEPLLNYANVTRAGRIFSNPAGPAIAAKAISISTAGVVPLIHRYIREPAISFGVLARRAEQFRTRGLDAHRKTMAVARVDSRDSRLRRLQSTTRDHRVRDDRGRQRVP